MVRLGDVGKVITGNTPKTSEVQNYASNDICFVKPSDIAEGFVSYLNDSEFYISEHARAKARVLPPKSVLVTCIGIIGKVAINTVECAFNQQINAIIPNESKCVPEYLAYAIQNKQTEMRDIANAPVVPILNKTQFSNVEIKLPSLAEQAKLVEKLNAVFELIIMRKAQLAKLDELVKSRFIELFGDIKETTKLALCCSRITDYVASGSFASIKENVKYYDTEEYAIMVKTADFANGFTKNLTYTDKHGYEFLHNSNLFGGELLLSNIGASIGKVHRVPKLNKPMTLAPNAIMIKGNELYLDDYLQYFFVSHLGQRQLKEMTTATAMPKFNKTQLKEVIVPIAPMALQQQFAAFVEQTDKSKFEIQKSLEKLETLKKALMQKYFG